MASTLRRIHTSTMSTAKKAAWMAGRTVLPKVLNYYKFNNSDKINLINAYNKYHKALNNRNASNARRNAENAAIKFTNTVFKMYEKRTSKRNPVSNGIGNGVKRSVSYWMPGIVVRHTVRRFRPASV